MTAYLLRMRSGKDGGGKGALVQTERSGTLATGNDQTLFIIENKCYRICSEASNCMKSSNPHSGIYETDLSPTLDTTLPTPTKAQGGLCVVALAGNTIGRKPMNGGNGNGFETDGKMYTLTATDIHGVCYENHAQDARYDEKTTCPTITSRYGTGGGNVPLTFGKVARAKGKDGLGERWDEIKIASTRNCMDIGDSRSQEAIVTTAQVRRLTPTECERLMGFPDGYTNIKENCPDSPRYKALGNSWAVPVVRWIGQRIDAALRADAVNDEVLKKEA